MTHMSVPTGSICERKLRLCRPSSRGVLSPSQEAISACPLSCSGIAIKNEMITINATRTFIAIPILFQLEDQSPYLHMPSVYAQIVYVPPSPWHPVSHHHTVARDETVPIFAHVPRRLRQ